MSQQNTGIRLPESTGVQEDAPMVIDAGAGVTQVRQKRAYLTDADQTNLMKLCVEYQAEHRPGKKTAFWSMISEMLLQLEGGGLRLRDPQGTVRGLVGARRATLKKQERESGTVQEETELTQAIDKWTEHEEDLERNLEVQKSPSAIEREALEAATQRMNLLIRRGRKRGKHGDVGDGEQGDSEIELAEELDSTGVAEGSEPAASGARKRRKGKETYTDDSIKNTELLVAAVDRLGESMVAAATVSSRNDSQTSERLDILERRLETQAEDNRESQKTMKDMLARILEKLN